MKDSGEGIELLTIRFKAIGNSHNITRVPVENIQQRRQLFMRHEKGMAEGRKKWQGERLGGNRAGTWDGRAMART